MLAHSKPGLQLLYFNAADGVIRDFDLVENSVRDRASRLIRYNICDWVLSSDSRPFSVWEGDGHFPESVGPSNVTNGLGDSLHLMIRQFGFGRSAAAPPLVGEFSCCRGDVPNSDKQFLVLIVFSPLRGRLRLTAALDLFNFCLDSRPDKLDALAEDLVVDTRTELALIEILHDGVEVVEGGELHLETRYGTCNFNRLVEVNEKHGHKLPLRIDLARQGTSLVVKPGSPLILLRNADNAEIGVAELLIDFWQPDGAGAVFGAYPWLSIVEKTWETVKNGLRHRLCVAGPAYKNLQELLPCELPRKTINEWSGQFVRLERVSPGHVPPNHVVEAPWLCGVGLCHLLDQVGRLHGRQIFGIKPGCTARNRITMPLHPMATIIGHGSNLARI